MFSKTVTIEIYMKSGNVIVIDGLRDFTVKCLENRVVELSLVRAKKFPKRRVIVTTIDLSQIEAICEIN